VAGVLLAVSFPKFGHAAFAWIALTPLLVAVHRQPMLRAAGLGFAAGVVYFGATLYWITLVMVVYGDVPLAAAVLINIALVAYLALFPVIFAMVMARLTAANGARALLTAPIVWVATELGRTYLLTGFPWVLLGYSQVSVLPVAQLASVFGVFGLSALVASVSATLAFAAVLANPSPAGVRSGRVSRNAFLPLAVSLGLVAMTAIWGSLRIRQGTLLTSGEAVRVGLLQGNVAEADRWQDQKAAEVFRRYLDMSRQAVAGGASFVVWPESATPYPFGEDINATDQMRGLARRLNVPVLIGSDQIVHGGETKYYNAAFLIRPDGSEGGVYRKMHLVPFGEYVPARHLFFFMSRIVQAVSDFSAGESIEVLPVDGHKVSTSICYEIVYPNLVRQFTAAGSELLTTITNDSWFGATSAPYQHFAQASMRAIENGRFLVRAANTGISGIVDPYGRVTARSGLFEPAVIVGDARFLRESTIYARTGDLLAYGCAVLTVVLLVGAVRSSRMKYTEF
jgi:apolipoprotein N-acyltransferase